MMTLRSSVTLGLASVALLSSVAMAETVNTSGWLKSEKADQWRASKLIGVNIYNDKNEKLGDVNDMIVDRSGKVDAVVIGVGGFLGIGEHDVAVPISEIKWEDQPRPGAANSTRPATNATGAPGPLGTANTAAPGAAMPPTAPASAPGAGTAASANAARTADNTKRGYPDHGILNMTKDELKAAPEFKYTNK